MEDKPKELRAVLAKIKQVTDLGESVWYEVVFYDDHIDNEWKSYQGSDTFKDGEQVVKWRYASDAMFESTSKHGLGYVDNIRNER